MKRYFYTFLIFVVSVSVSGQTRLNDYLKIAAENNPFLKSKFSLYMAALESVNQQNALPDPKLSFGYFISPVETRVGAQRFRLSIAQMFPWMGTLKTREKAASSFAKVKFEEFLSAKNELFLDVKTKWLELYELEEEIKLMEANLAILLSYEPITKTKYEANLVSLADLVRVQISIDNAKVQLDLLRLKIKPLEEDFNTLLNREPVTSIVLADTFNVRLTDNRSNYTLINQPKIKELESALETLDYEKELVELSRKPNIGLGLEYGFISKRNGVTISDNGKDILLPTVTMSLPIFGKKNRSKKKEVDLKIEGLKSQLLGVENELKNSWTHANYEIESAKKELSLFNAEMAKTDVLLNVLISEYTNNNEEFEALLETQQRQLQLRLSILKANMRYHLAIFKKDYLTGFTLNEIQDEIK